uniref:WGS project CAEQ00000000 data, annotated contig 309 n=1 Tax=Trypanosoma congolense (strain IL3000) TaxID=1068625 RepID=F9WES3_TRYCI|nr:unnamed protein product [Trypanosoma congolense IL3000]
MAAPVPVASVGELACQRNSFLREITARVVSSQAAPMKDAIAGANKKGKNASSGTSAAKLAYDVILTDSVLFPEGGGQPCDHGVLIRSSGHCVADEREFEVHNVRRQGNSCVLTLPCMLEPGEEVRLRVDWDRRVDHMQHHSAQHLLTAVVEDPSFCGLPTVSWSLTQPHCHIVLPTGEKIKQEVIQRIEDRCNSLIAEATPVHCEVYRSKEEYEMEMQKRREEGFDTESVQGCRPIPADITGPIRIINMEGVDSCTCCGTHVTNLSQLQSVKLLHQETKGATLKLFFIAGNRVLRHFGEMFLRERQLMKEMGGVRPEDFVQTAIRKGRDFIELEKRLKHMTSELMKLQSEKLIVEAKRLSEQGKDGNCANSKAVLTYRRDDVDADFFSGLRDELQQACPGCVGVFAWATAPATAAQTGQFLIVGPVKDVETLAPAVCEALAGKGGMSKLGYRGKGNLSGWEDLVEKLNPKQ